MKRSSVALLGLIAMAGVAPAQTFIETPTPASDTTRLSREAHELADLHTAFANTSGISRIAVSICRTPACSALHAPPPLTISFVRASDRTWVRDMLRRND